MPPKIWSWQDIEAECSRPRHGSHGILSQSPDSSEGKRIVCAADSCYQGALELIRKTSQATSVGTGAVGLCLEKERWHRSGSPYKIKMGWSWSGGAAGRTHCLCLNALEALEVQLRSTTCGHSLRSIGSVFFISSFLQWRIRDLLDQGRGGGRARCGAVDVASEGPPPSEAECLPVPSSADINSPAQRTSVARMPTIPEESSPIGPGAGHRLDDSSNLEQLSRELPEAPALTRILSHSVAGSQEEPLAEPLPEKRRKTPTDTVGESTPTSSSSAEVRERVKRRVAEIEKSRNKETGA